MVRNELDQYSPSFLDKKECIVITKRDLMTPEQQDLARKIFGPDIVMVSAVSKENLPTIEQKLWHSLSL
jgi:GTPase involved in cell partitioning and DNA repair